MSQTYTTRMTLVFAVPAINQQTAASIERIVVTEAGQAFPLPTAVDPTLVAGYAPEWNLAAVAERDELKTEKATLEATVQTLTTERDSEKAAKDAALAQAATLTEQLTAVTAERDRLAPMESQLTSALAEVERLKAELEAIKNPTYVPLIPTTVIRRMGFARFGAVLEACKSDPQLNTIVQFMLAAREITSDAPEFAQSIQYVVAAGHATQVEVDAWFAPGAAQ